MAFMLQRIKYAKTKSDIIAKADGTFVPRERRKRQDERGEFCLAESEYIVVDCPIHRLYFLSYLCLRNIYTKSMNPVLL